MFDLEEMQGCHSCVNEKDFDTEKEPCKSCNNFSHYKYKKDAVKVLSYSHNNNKYYFIACEYQSMLEEFDRFLSNARNETDLTSAFLRNGWEHKLSHNYSRCLKDAMIYKYNIYDWNNVIDEINKHSNYSAQKWINEYETLRKTNKK